MHHVRSAPRLPSVVGPALAMVLALSAGACAKDDGATVESGAEAADRISERALDEEGLILQEIDIDANGTADIRNTFKERSNAARLQVKKEVDLNFDGRFDVVSEFDATGTLLIERMDSDFDGLVDWTDHYKDGTRVMAEVDTNFDGRTDTWFYYVDDGQGSTRIDRKERDTTGDGKVDLWERFDAEGQVIRMGRDTDGDGKMDQRSE